MINAKDARKQLSNTLSDKERTDVGTLHEMVNDEIRQSIAKGLCQATIIVPSTIEYEIVVAFSRSCKKLGYSSKVSTKGGTFGGNLIRLPQTVLTLGW